MLRPVLPAIGFVAVLAWLLSAPAWAASDAQVCASDTEHDAAIGACTRLLKQRRVTRKQRARWYGYRGYSRFFLDDYKRSLADLNRSLALQSRAFEPRYWRGVVYYHLERFDKALADLQRAARMKPRNAGVLYWRGRTKHALYRFEGAVKDLSRAVSLDGSDVDYRRFWADALLDSGDAAKAERVYTETIKRDSRYAEAYRGRGIARTRLKDYEAAISDLVRAIGIAPKDWYSYRVRGDTYLEWERYNDAISDYSEALRLEPNNADLLNQRAHANMMLDRLRVAMRDVDKALKVDRAHAVAITTRAEILEKQGKRRQAIKEFKRALAIDGTIADAKRGLNRLGASDDRRKSESRPGREKKKQETCRRFLPAVGILIDVPCEPQ